MHPLWGKLTTFRSMLLCTLVATAGACGDHEGGGFDSGADLAIGVTPTTLSFPSGIVSERMVVVRHVGESGVLRLDEIHLVGDAIGLTLEGLPARDIEPGASASWAVRYTPQAGETPDAALVMRTNAPGYPAVEIPISVTNGAGALSINPTLLDFGILTPGTEQTRDVVLSNTGLEPVEVLGVALSGDTSPDFAIASPDSAVALASGDSRAVAVRYRPTGWDSDEGTITLSTSAGSYEVALAGRELGPVIAAIPETVAFGPVAIGDTAVHSLRLENAGALPLEISAIQLAEGATSGLTLAGAAEVPMPLQLPVGGSVCSPCPDSFREYSSVFRGSPRSL